MKKFLFALCLSLFTSVAMACTNFSGSYRGEEGVYTVSQSGCASVTISDSNGDMTLITDGQFRVVEDAPEARIMTAASFVGNNLTMENRIEYKVPFPPEVPADAIPSRIVVVVVKNAAGALVQTTTFYNSKGQSLGSESTTHPKA